MSKGMETRVAKAAGGASVLLALLLAVFMCLGAPASALAAGSSDNPDPYAKAASVDLDDGTYSIDVSMVGGSGRASVSSPATMTVKDGKAAATIEWSSQFYDYMLVDGDKYVQINDSGNSQFTIPVTTFDGPMDVVADTVAMSTPHEIDYQLTFDLSTAQAQQPSVPVVPIVICIVVAAVIVGIIVGVVRTNRKNKAEEAKLG